MRPAKKASADVKVHTVRVYGTDFVCDRHNRTWWTKSVPLSAFHSILLVGVFYCRPSVHEKFVRSGQDLRLMQGPINPSFTVN